MRWYNKLRLVFRIYSRRMFVTLLLFGMCFVSFFMIDRVFTGYIGSRYAIRQTEKEFGVNTADAGYVHFVTRDIKQDIPGLPAPGGGCPGQGNGGYYARAGQGSHDVPGGPLDWH